MKPIKEIISAEEYKFIFTNEHLKDQLVFLTYGGSHAYGTATPTSDIDIRGCAFNRKSDLLGLSNFEQVVEEKTDTTIYSFKKLINLLLNVNPNCIELLGCKPEQYLMFSPIAQELIDNRKMFLSRRAVNSFVGYATQQLMRLQNAVARDALTEAEKEKHILGSINSAMMSFNDKYATFDEGAVKIYIGKSNKTDMDSEILMDINLTGYPLRDYKAMWSEMNEVVKAYGKLNHRNRKKDERHLNKHAMHLIRLYLMAIDVFEKEEIITHRENDLDLLNSIRNGKFMNDDGTYQCQFFELVSDYENRLAYAVKNSSLPTNPNFKQVEEFVISVNERVL
ncbi:MAG: nucleotidyltransferase domain-containing protein [Defluviitaleaceae bacterium]|nr:nucleotidyltransferase domain-containing protein [Defluviitaleaceae bacterium]